MVDLFEQNGALLNLFEACAAGRLSRAEVLLERAPAMANGHSADGYPALGLAVFFGHEDVAALLLEHGADVNAASKNAQRVTPLHAAVARRNVKLVRALLDRGADPNAEQAGGFTPLHGAAYHGDREVVEALLSRGADARKRTTDGKTPADLAREHGNPAIAERLDSATATA
jgi:ankyrin repeat protein